VQRHTARPLRSRRLAFAALLASFAAFPAAADAAFTVGANAPALGFPASVTDPVSGVALTACQDASGFCVETPAPNPAAPLSVPGNYTPDGEGFYMLADATVPNAGIGLARFALEQAFTGPDPVAGQQIMFARIRFRFGGLKPGTTYRMTHPYGVDEIAADGAGIINSTEDLGCLGPPCNFQTATWGRISSFLRWDPTVAPAAPAGYTGNVFIPHQVIGSPTGTNFVRVEELAGGVPVSVIGETDQFLVQGKLAGAAPAAAPFAIADAATLDFASRQSGTSTPAKTVTLSNHGTAPLAVSGATVGGADAADFQLGTNGCAAAVAPGSSCTIGVVFAPQASGTRNATLTIASNSLGAPHVIALKGTGTPAATPAPAPTVIQAPALAPIVIKAPGPVLAKAASLTASRLSAASRVKLRQARGRGITVTFTAPANAAVARVRLVKPGASRSVAAKLVDIETSGVQVVHLRVRGVRAGRYRLEVATGRGASSLTKAVSQTVTLTR
jgi:hypothetical protein